MHGLYDWFRQFCYYDCMSCCFIANITLTYIVLILIFQAPITISDGDSMEDTLPYSEHHVCLWDKQCSVLFNGANIP